MTDDLEKRRSAYRAALDDAMLILKGEERAEEVKLDTAVVASPKGTVLCCQSVFRGEWAAATLFGRSTMRTTSDSPNE